MPNVTNALTAGYNSSAVLTRQLQNIFAATTSLASGAVLDSHDFQVDAQCPFFYIFAIGGQANATTGPAFKTTFTFTNGGTPSTSVTVGWGNQETLNGGPDNFVSILTTPNDGIGYFHDPLSATCAAVNPGTLDWQGFVKRWTCLADSVRAVTALYGAYDFSQTGQACQIVHGLLQQPW